MKNRPNAPWAVSDKSRKKDPHPVGPCYFCPSWLVEEDNTRRCIITGRLFSQTETYLMGVPGKKYEYPEGCPYTKKRHKEPKLRCGNCAYFMPFTLPRGECVNGDSEHSATDFHKDACEQWTTLFPVRNPSQNEE